MMGHHTNLIYKGVSLMLFSSLLTCVGQLFWKLAAQSNPFLFLFAGFLLYGCSALLMLLALRYGDLSTLHPMLGAGYALSVVLGAVVLGERLTLFRLFGIAVIIVGLILISTPEEKT